jgi:hypothetical protein
MNPNSIFLQHLGYNLPAMIVMVVGMVWTHTTWQRHPPAARWAITAFVWLFITYVLAIIWYSFGSMFLAQNNLPPDQTPYLTALSCCEALAYVFFMLALNAARYPYRPPHYYDQFTEDDDPARTP